MDRDEHGCELISAMEPADAIHADEIFTAAGQMATRH
jgi:hypothetical protein